MSDCEKRDLKLRLACPHCRGETRIRTSRMVTGLYRQLYLVCLDLECGFTFAADLTITHGLSPSGNPNPNVHLRMAPPRMRRARANDGLPSRHSGPEVPPLPANDDAPVGEASA